MIPKNRFRKAADGGNLLVIGVAIGVIVVIGMFLFAKDMMTDVSEAQGNMGTAMEQGLENLKNN